MNFTAVDFETASRKRNSACAVGIVHVKNDEITDEIYSLIKPSDPYFDPMCERIHGITWDHVKDSPDFQALWTDISQYFEGHMVIAHNASFDMSVLRHTLNEYSIPDPYMEYNCTVSIAKKTWPEFYNFKLNTVAHYLDIPLRHHHALDDARAAARIVLKACEIHDAYEKNLFLNKLNICNGAISPGSYSTPGQNKRLRAKKKRKPV